MNIFKKSCVALLGLCALVVVTLFSAWPNTRAASHREAPLTAMDRLADITDFFAFRSPENPDTVVFIMGVDPLLEPANGPNYFPFDPEILYEIKVDNDHDAVADITFQFQFQTEIRLPDVFTGFVGISPDETVIDGVLPPPITALDGPGSQGLSLRQTYSVILVKDGPGKRATELTADTPLFAVPSNVGPRTMPDYPSLAEQGVYTLENGVRVFAGTTDDPFYIDLGAAFDTFNLRVPVLTAAQDADDDANAGDAVDAVSGFNVNNIAIEVPISMLTSNGKICDANEPCATIGAYATTSRAKVRKLPNEPGGKSVNSAKFVQIQRMGNPLFNELIIGTGSKDEWSMSDPADDAQFADFALDPLLAQVLRIIFGIEVPDAPRTDLLPLVQYVPPIASADTPAGPVADLLRLNTGVMPTGVASSPETSRLGLLAGDPAGHPNGRRYFDDVTDIAARIVAGVLVPGFNVFPNNSLGDGVNTNDVEYLNVFPFVGYAHDGRDHDHLHNTAP